MAGRPRPTLYIEASMSDAQQQISLFSHCTLLTTVVVL